MAEHDIALEFMRRTLAGQSAADLLPWVTTALRNGAGNDANPFLSEWQPRTLADALQERPPRTHFVARLLREASLSIVFGAPGSLKSLLLMDMLACIVAGRPWLDTLPGAVPDQEPFATVPVPCMWIDYDNGEDLTDERFRAFAHTYNLPESAPLTYYSIALPWLDLSKRDNAFHFMGLIQRSGAKVIVIDNLGLIKGGANENTDEMQPVMSHLRQIADTTGAAIVLIHHQRKSGTNGDAGGPRKGETLRGYSGIEAACDLVLHIERRPNEDTVILTPTKVRRAIPFEAAGALFTYQNGDGDVLTDARFFAQTVETAKAMLIRAVRATILDMLGAHPGSNQSQLVTFTRDWFAAAGQKVPGRDLIRGVAQGMADNGEIVERRGEKSTNQAEIRYYKP